MAERPIFAPNLESGPLVLEDTTEFEWHPGFAVSQKQKSIASLHENAKESVRPILEISTKSESELGRKMSAFNLEVVVQKNHEMKVETAYQGSKVFENGGPYADLYELTPREAKKDSRLYESGDLTEFNLLGDIWALEPKTAFYDWIYVNALYQHKNLHDELMRFRGFTDIEFNPKKQVNCQARAAALFVSFAKRGILRKTLKDKTEFIRAVESPYHNPINENGKVSENEEEEELWIQGNLFGKTKEDA